MVRGLAHLLTEALARRSRKSQRSGMHRHVHHRARQTKGRDVAGVALKRQRDDTYQAQSNALSGLILGRSRADAAQNHIAAFGIQPERVFAFTIVVRIHMNLRELEFGITDFRYILEHRLRIVRWL